MWLNSLYWQVLSLLQPVIYIAGFIVCYRYRRLSTRLNIVAAGFGTFLARWLCGEVFFELRPRFLGVVNRDLMLPLTGIAEVAGEGLIVIGLALVLASIKRRFDAFGDIISRRKDTDALESQIAGTPKREENHDIQR